MVLGVGFEPTKAGDRQIYSLLRLTTSLSQQIVKFGAANQAWTDDLPLTRRLLYQLSYCGISYILLDFADFVKVFGWSCSFGS